MIKNTEKRTCVDKTHLAKSSVDGVTDCSRQVKRYQEKKINFPPVKSTFVKSLWKSYPFSEFFLLQFGNDNLSPKCCWRAKKKAQTDETFVDKNMILQNMSIRYKNGKWHSSMYKWPLWDQFRFIFTNCYSIGDILAEVEQTLDKEILNLLDERRKQKFHLFEIQTRHWFIRECSKECELLGDLSWVQCAIAIY